MCVPTIGLCGGAGSVRVSHSRWCSEGKGVCEVVNGGPIHSMTFNDGLRRVVCNWLVPVLADPSNCECSYFRAYTAVRYLPSEDSPGRSSAHAG
jgi:hypothetical protein